MLSTTTGEDHVFLKPSQEYALPATRKSSYCEHISNVLLPHNANDRVHLLVNNRCVVHSAFLIDLIKQYLAPWPTVLVSLVFM